MTVQQEASLHEKAVQRVAAGKVAPIKRARRSSAPRLLATPAHVTRVHPDLMRVARRLAKGDMRRVVINSESEVLVLNTHRKN